MANWKLLKVNVRLHGTRKLGLLLVLPLLAAIVLLLCHNARAAPAQADESMSLDYMAGWRSDDYDETNSVAWGDVDGDGDLDLAVGNGKSDEAQPQWGACFPKMFMCGRLLISHLIDLNSEQRQGGDTGKKLPAFYRPGFA